MPLFSRHAGQIADHDAQLHPSLVVQLLERREGVARPLRDGVADELQEPVA